MGPDNGNASGPVGRRGAEKRSREGTREQKTGTGRERKATDVVKVNRDKWREI